jgi:putative membrane protein
VDRDDDFGIKAGITSPIIGRKDNLRAAISLGLSDPEDSDTNSLFAAIQLYDQHRESDEDVEIATLCGNKSVGTKSDRIIGIQLETVLELLNPDHVVMVSDGAEDEFILPIISSRIKIDSIKRVIIRQQKNIEGTFYFITKAMQDERIRKNLLIPFALVLLIWGIFSFWKIEYAIGATLIALGLYILVKAFRLEEPVILVGKDIRDALQTGKYILFGTSIIAILVLIIGIGQGYISIIGDSGQIFPLNILVFLRNSFIFFIGAFLIYILGKTLDTYLRTGEILRSSISLILSGLAAWFIFLAIIHITQYFFNIIENFDFLGVMMNIFLGGLIGFISIEIYFYIKHHFPEEIPNPQD